MRVDPVRAGVATIVLAEVGTALGTVMAWLYLVGRVALWQQTVPDAQALLGASIWALLIGGPVGALGLPALGLTVLRRVPLGRALGYTTVGALAGLAAGVYLAPHNTVAVLPVAVPLLTLGGALVGAGTGQLQTRLAGGRSRSALAAG